MKKGLFKSALSIGLAFLMTSSCFTMISFAKGNENEHRDSLNASVFITNNQSDKKDAIQEDISAKNTTDITDDEVRDANVVIVNFEELYNDKNFANEVAEQIRCGKAFYIRADGYSANATIISQTLGIKDNTGYIHESTDNALRNREGTFGYVVFVDANGNLQIVRQQNVIIDQTYDIDEIDKIKSNEFDEQIDDISVSNKNETNKMHTSISDISFDFADELDAIDSFFDEISPSDIGKYSQQNVEYLSPQSTFTSYVYEDVYGTEFGWGTVKTSSSTTENVKIGAVTRAVYAERMYCATSNWSDTSKITSKWGYMADIWMQPSWNKSTSYRAMNYTLAARFNTFPQGTNNATYQMIFRDYAPTVDLSGETKATLSLGANAAYDDGTVIGGSAGFSVETSYKDVEITVPYWITGKNNSNNIAGWEFLIGHSLTRWTTNPVATSTIKLPIAVVLWNYGTKYSCIQLNTDAYWYVNQGATNSNDIVLRMSHAVVWQPAALY